MYILAIETSTIAASVAVVCENKLCGEAYTDYKLKHSEKLLPLVEHLLSDLRMNIGDMDAFAVGSGPGSFTGIRIGAASIKGLAHASDKPLIGVSSLEACAFGQSYFPGHICPIFDAQRDEVYTSLFNNTSGGFQRISNDKAMPVELLLSSLENKGRVMFCGDGLYKYKDYIIDKMGDFALFANPLTAMPHASGVGYIALNKLAAGDVSDYKSFLPVYIRKPQIDVGKGK